MPDSPSSTKTTTPTPSGSQNKSTGYKIRIRKRVSTSPSSTAGTPVADSPVSSSIATSAFQKNDTSSRETSPTSAIPQWKKNGAKNDERAKDAEGAAETTNASTTDTTADSDRDVKITSFRSAAPAVSSGLTNASSNGRDRVIVRRKSSITRGNGGVGKDGTDVGHKSEEIEESIKEHVVHQQQLQNVREQHQETATMLVRKLSVIKRKQAEERSMASSPGTMQRTDSMGDRRKSGSSSGVMDFLKKLPSAENNYRREEEERKHKSRSSMGNSMVDIFKALPSAESNYRREEEERKHNSRTSSSSDTSDVVSNTHALRSTHLSELKQHLETVDLPNSVTPLSKEMIEELYGVIVDDDDDDDDEKKDNAASENENGAEDEDEDEDEMVTDEVVTRFDMYFKNPLFDETSGQEPVIMLTEEECFRLNEMVRIMNEKFGGDLKNYRMLQIIDSKLLGPKVASKRMSRSRDALFGKLLVGRNSTSFRLGKTGQDSRSVVHDIGNAISARDADLREAEDDDDGFRFKPQYSIAKCSRNWKTQFRRLREGTNSDINHSYSPVPYMYECSRALHAHMALRSKNETQRAG